MNLHDYAASLAAAAPPLTAEQIEGAARILASVDTDTTLDAAA